MRDLLATFLSHSAGGATEDAVAAAAVQAVRRALGSFAAVARGMQCSGRDEGVRPIHLVIVGGACRRMVAEHHVTSEMAARRLAAFAVAAARDHLLEYRAARFIVLELVELGRWRACSLWQAIVEPLPTTTAASSSAGTIGGDDGFRARCKADQRSSLESLVTSLLARGVGVCEASLPDAALLAAAEGEARRMHAADMLQPSTVKSTGTDRTLRYKDPSSRGDVVRWLDGSDRRYPASAALAQWLRGELMDAVREACAAAPPGSLPAAGRAPQLVFEPFTSLPIAMLACYPGGGARFKRHVDNSPESPDTRAVTAILYLNGEWSANDGGALRVYAPPVACDAGRGYLEVAPRRGTLVLFWSHLTPHEVMPAFTPRYALSLWMCTAPQQPDGWLEGCFRSLDEG